MKTYLLTLALTASTSLWTQSESSNHLIKGNALYMETLVNNHSNYVHIHQRTANIDSDRQKKNIADSYLTYKVHQKANLLESSDNIKNYQCANSSIPEVKISTSKDKSRKIHITIVNLNHRSTCQSHPKWTHRQTDKGKIRAFPFMH